MWLSTSLTPVEVYGIYKLTCTPVIFWGVVSDMVLILLLRIQLFYFSPNVAGMFVTVWFGFSKGFLPFFPGDPFRH